jgi:hypothetical protein
MSPIHVMPKVACHKPQVNTGTIIDPRLIIAPFYNLAPYKPISSVLALFLGGHGKTRIKEEKIVYSSY